MYVCMYVRTIVTKVKNKAVEYKQGWKKATSRAGKWLRKNLGFLGFFIKKTFKTSKVQNLGFLGFFYF